MGWRSEFWTDRLINRPLSVQIGGTKNAGNDRESLMSLGLPIWPRGHMAVQKNQGTGG